MCAELEPNETHQLAYVFTILWLRLVLVSIENNNNNINFINVSEVLVHIKVN